MSKLIELIGRLGQQSAQPIGFGALIGRVEASPTMALIGDVSQGAFTGGMDEEMAGVADAMLFMGAESESILTNTFDESMIWGVSCEKLTGDELDVLEEAGCDYFVIDSQTASAAVIGRPDVGTIVMMSEAADRETAMGASVSRRGWNAQHIRSGIWGAIFRQPGAVDQGRRFDWRGDAG